MLHLPPAGLQETHPAEMVPLAAVAVTAKKAVTEMKAEVEAAVTMPSAETAVFTEAAEEEAKRNPAAPAKTEHIPAVLLLLLPEGVPV